jgi:hypothetical protein
MLSGLAGDLIYLYFAGGWTDKPFIVVAELVLCAGLVVAGGIRFWQLLREIISIGRNKV